MLHSVYMTSMFTQKFLVICDKTSRLAWREMIKKFSHLHKFIASLFLPSNYISWVSVTLNRFQQNCLFHHARNILVLTWWIFFEEFWDFFKFLDMLTKQRIKMRYSKYPMIMAALAISVQEISPFTVFTIFLLQQFRFSKLDFPSPRTVIALFNIDESFLPIIFFIVVWKAHNMIILFFSSILLFLLLLLLEVFKWCSFCYLIMMLASDFLVLVSYEGLFS